MGSTGATHEVTNQPPPLEGHDVFGTDVALVEAVTREAPGRAVDELTSLGRLAGSAEAQRWGEQANESPPVLRSHDRFGHRLDRVDYHPAYHELIERYVLSWDTRELSQAGMETLSIVAYLQPVTRSGVAWRTSSFSASKPLVWRAM